MPRYVVLLRGVNVGGSGRMAMADLRACVEGIGHEDVATHIQTGNVILRASSRSAESVGKTVEAAVAKDLGFETSAMVRSVAQLRRVLDTEPFPDADPAALHVAFLRERPDAATAGALVAPEGPDELVVVGQEVHLRYPDGMGRSKLSGAYLEKRLGVPLTARKRTVVAKLLEE